MSLIDWTLSSTQLEVINHHAKNEYDMFSDHIPIEFVVKIDYSKHEIKNELITLWGKLKNEWTENEFRQRIQIAYSKIEDLKLMTNKCANE